MSAGEGFQIIQWDVINERKKDRKESKGDLYENSGTLILKSIKIDQVDTPQNQHEEALVVIDSLLFQDTTFLDYIRGGLRLHFVVAVDFTVSNGDPTQPESLHYYDRDRPENPYTMAIKTIGDIFQDYDYGEESGYLGWECLEFAVRFFLLLLSITPTCSLLPEYGRINVIVIIKAVFLQVNVKSKFNF